MEVKIFILLFFLISIRQVHGNFNIDVIQEEAKERNKLTLIKGRYSKLFIRLTSNGNTDLSTALISTIKFSDERFKLSDENITIDTSKLRGIQTNIGIPCSSSFNPEEMENGVTAWFKSENEDNFSSSNITIIIKEEITTIRIEHSAETIPFKGVGGFFISSELRNVDPIIISSDFDEKYKNDFGIESSEIDLKSNYEKFGHYNKITKYYSKTNKNIEGIEIKFKLQNEEVNSMCYKIENPTIKINVKNTETISNTNNKKFPLIGSTCKMEMWITSISSKLLPSFIDCAIISEDHDFPTNEQILAQEEIKGIPSSELKYIKQAIGTNHANINFVSTTFRRMKNYKYKCIYQNNAYESSAKTSFEFIGDNRINYLRTQKVKPICLNLYFSFLEKPDEFDVIIRNYLLNLIVNEQNMTDNFDFAYTRFLTRNIQEYYNETLILKSICGYIDDVFSENMENKLDKTIQEFNNSILSSANVNCKLEKNETVTYAGLETYSLNVEIYEHTKDKLVVNVESNEANNHILCDYLVLDENDTSKLILAENQRLVFDKSERKEKIEIKFPSDKDFDQKNYILVFNCSPLVGLDYFSSLIYTYRFTHSHENSFNCLTDLKVPQCVDISIKKKTFTGFPKLKFMDSISEYKNNTFKEKSNKLQQQTNLLTSAAPELDALQHFYIFLFYMENYNCVFSTSYKTCRETKKKYQESVSPLFEKIFLSNNTLIELYDSIKKPQKILENIALSFYILFLEENNGDSFNQNSLNAFMNVYKKFVKEYSNILSYMEKKKKNDTQYKEAVQKLFPLIINNMQNIFTHMEADNLLNNKNITEDPKGSYVIQDETLKQYKKLLTSTLAPYYIKNNIHEETLENFKFYYRPLEQTTLRKLENKEELTYTLGDIKVTVPISTLISEEKIKGLVFYIYERYPLLSVLSSKKYSQIISIRRYNQNDTITDEDVSLFQSSTNSIKVTYSKATLDKVIPSCIYFMNENITHENITTTVNSKDETITCSAGFLADIGIENNDIPSPQDLDWWMILLICILCAGITACFVFLGYYCFFYKKKYNTLQNDIENQGKILNDVFDSQNN